MQSTKSDLAAMPVRDRMRQAFITCPPDTPLRTVASQMADERIHCVVVPSEGTQERVDWSVVSDLDLMRAAG